MSEKHRFGSFFLLNRPGHDHGGGAVSEYCREIDSGTDRSG